MMVLPTVSTALRIEGACQWQGNRRTSQPGSPTASDIKMLKGHSKARTPVSYRSWWSVRRVRCDRRRYHSWSGSDTAIDSRSRTAAAIGSVSLRVAV